MKYLNKPLEWVNPAVRAKKPKRLPVVLTREEVTTILELTLIRKRESSAGVIFTEPQRRMQ